MYKIIIAFLSIALLTLSCKNKENTISNKNEISIADTIKLFPVLDLLKEDIEDVKKTPYYIYKKTAIGIGAKYKDSVQISADNFITTIAPILAIQLNDNQGKKLFKEESFHDLSTKSFSIITTPLNESSELKSITTLLNDETNKLKTIFFVFEKTAGDTSIKTTYYWKAKKSLRIGKSHHCHEKNTFEQKEFINWNDIAE